MEDAGFDAWPSDDEAPVRSIVIMDPDGFGVGFMRTLLKVTGDEGHAGEELSIETAAIDEEAAPSLGAAFQTERVVLRACGQRLDLRLMEDRYPDWRRLSLGVAGERVEGMRLAPRLLGLISKLKDVLAVDLDFHGTEKYVSFASSTGASKMRGLIMPMRRYEKESPAPPAEPESDDQADLDNTTVTLEGAGKSVTMTGKQFSRAAKDAAKGKRTPESDAIRATMRVEK
jgi:hypothetical protein